MMNLRPHGIVDVGLVHRLQRLRSPRRTAHARD
jgi:hypothetical protein